MNKENIKNILVSIIMSSYNHEDYIGYAINSVINQTHKNWELIIIDDGSTDGTVKKIKKFLHDDRISFFQQQNSGVSITLNRAIKKSRGEVICFLDSDDAFHKTKLEKQLKYYLNGYNMIATEVEGIDENSNPLKDDSVDKWFNDYRKDELTKENIEKSFLKKNYFCKASIMISKALLKKYGVFDERLITAYDYHLWLRVIGDARVKICEDRLTYYRWHGKNEAITNQLRLQVEIVLILWEKYNIINNKKLLEIIKKRYVTDSLLTILGYCNLYLKKSEGHIFDILEINNFWNDLSYLIERENKNIEYIKVKEKELSDIYKNRNHLRGLLNIKEYEVKQLEASLSAKEVEVKQLEASLSAKEVEVKQLEASLSAKEVEVKHLEVVTSEKEMEIGRIKNSKFWKLRNKYIKLKNKIL